MIPDTTTRSDSTGTRRNTKMTGEEFKQHFISALSELGIEHPEDTLFVVEPYIEPDKPRQTFDEIMRLQVLPKARKMTFDQVINVLTMWEGYFPCRIDISRQEDDIVLKTYLRMRKVPKKDNNDIFPFKVVSDHTLIKTENI